MQIDFSIISENLANTYADASCIVNVERDRRYSFREYHLVTNRIVNMMHTRLDLRRGDIWLCILNNDNLSLLGQFVAFKGEACACYTNTTDSLEDQARQLDLVKPKVAFIESDLLATHYALLKERGVTIVSMDPAPRGFPGVRNFWTLMKGASAANPNVLHDDRDDCVYLRFTGGTTGAAKAVMYSIDNWMATKDLHYATPDCIPTGAARLLHFGMISHASGIVVPPIMFKGGCNITMNDRNLLTWCRAVESEKATASLMVPSMLYRLLEAPETRDFDLASLQTMYYGASPISPSKLKQLIARFGNIFVQLYGSSEHSSAVAFLAREDHLIDAGGDESHLASAGRVTPGVEVQIVDGHGRPLPQGKDGEIWIRSRAISMGYLHAAEKTAAEFCNGYWKSGDFGRIDANGYLYVLDRVKDTIICNDRKVYPSQVEAALSSHPQVLMAAVVGIPDSRCGESVHAEVLALPGESIDLKELRGFLAKRLSRSNLPRTITVATSIPLSPVGKVLRRAVRESCLRNNSSTSSSTKTRPSRKRVNARKKPSPGKRGGAS